MFPEKPHVSAPNIGIPNNENDNACEIEKNISAHLELLSPPQCAAYFPDPANVARPRIKGRFWGKTWSRPEYVALRIWWPLRLWTSYSGMLSMCVALGVVVVHVPRFTGESERRVRRVEVQVVRPAAADAEGGAFAHVDPHAVVGDFLVPEG